MTEEKPAMRGIFRRLAIAVAFAGAPLAFATLASSGVGNAADCGQGTVLDPVSNTCVAAEQPLPPPPPAWNGPTPYVSVGICAPIPFVSLCVGI
jgi:hypothetical protein